MGTTKSGRVLNTRGAAGSASQFSVVHSNEGHIRSYKRMAIFV